MISRLIIVSVLSLFISAKHVAGQDFPDLQFEHITVKEGLSSNRTTSIAEDKQGFIWIGTSNGLNRYDGYRFKQYYHSETDSNTLVNNDVQRLYCDSRGRIWISTEDGVSCFLPLQGRFINFSSKFNSPYKLKNNSSVGVYEDESGMIWLFNQRDVIYKVLDNFTLQEIKINIPVFLMDNQPMLGYDNIFRDKNGKEWAFKANRIYSLDKITKQPDKIFDFSDIIKNFVLKICQDQSNKYFVITYGNGMLQFLPTENILKPLPSISGRICSDITEWDFKNEKWLIALEANSGLFLLDKTHTRSRKYGFTPADPSSLHGNVLSQAFIDKKSNLWIASDGGINKVNKEQNIFEIIPVTDPGTVNYQFDRTGPVYSFFETGNSVWLSKRFVSTFEYDTAFHLLGFYSGFLPLSGSLSSKNSGWAYYFYQKGNELYITTDTGLIIYDPDKRTSHIYFPDEFKTGIGLRTIVEFGENEILIRSFSEGLFVFNTKEKKFTMRFTNDDLCKGCPALRSSYLFRTKQNEIFLSTSMASNGLLKFDAVTGSFKTVKPVNDSRNVMQANDLYGMDEDKDGNLWITGKSGLFVYDPSTNSILGQHNENGQIGGLVRICFDNTGNAWASGSSGVWCYIMARKKWISFNWQDGLPGNDFEGVIAKRPNGDIVAGLEGAIAVFHPDRLTENRKGYPVVITDAVVGDSSFSFPLENSGTKKLELSPGQNSFSVDFAALNYLSPASSRYYYKLSPLMKDFHLNNNGHINFNGLKPGTYTLYVRAGDKAGNIFENEEALVVYIKPGWFQAGWFKILVAIALASIIFYFVRRRIFVIKKEASFRQKIAETEMQALRAQMNPHFIFNSLNSIENFIMLNEKKMASDYLNKFSTLIRSILDSSRNEMVPLVKDMEILKLYVELEQLRFNNKFSYQSNVDPQLLNGDYKVPSLLIQPYIENAIVHGIAHSDKNDLKISIKAELENDKIKYTILDNGIGRKQAAEYNRQNKPGHKSVGLMITAERIAHFNKQSTTNGSVRITDLSENNSPSGTKVEIILNAN